MILASGWRCVALVVAVVACLVGCSSGTRTHPVVPRVPPDSLAQAVNLRAQSRHDAAVQELERLLTRPVSPTLRVEAQWELYVTERERDRPLEALKALVACAGEEPTSPWIQHQVEMQIGPAVVDALDRGELWNAVSSELEPLRDSPVLLGVVSSLLDTGRCRAASSMLALMNQARLDPRDEAQRSDLLRRVTRCLERSGKTVVLVVPLSGEYGEYGTSLWHGVSLAIEDTSALAIRVEDSKSDPVEAVRAVERAATAPDVIAAIGPLQSRAATGAALAASRGELPLLVPLSAPTGLDRLGSWVFQSAVPLQSEAKAVARYALIQGGLTRLAVLYPAHTSGERALEAFRDQVLALGGDVVAIERYAEGRDTNFRDQIVNLKRAAPQAVFVPGEPREVVQIARQIAFYELECQLLGTSGWGQPQVIADGGRLVNGVIFADLVEVSRDGHASDVFAARYRDRFGSDPDHYAGLGYDLASVIWRGLMQNATSREDLRRYFSRLGPYGGVSGVLSWRDESTQDVRLHTISDGMVVPLRALQR